MGPQTYLEPVVQCLEVSSITSSFNKTLKNHSIKSQKASMVSQLLSWSLVSSPASLSLILLGSFKVGKRVSMLALSFCRAVFLGFWFFLLLAVTTCYGDNETAEVIGIVECADCTQKNFKISQTLSGTTLFLAQKWITEHSQWYEFLFLWMWCDSFMGKYLFHFKYTNF